VPLEEVGLERFGMVVGRRRHRELRSFLYCDVLVTCHTSTSLLAYISA
jgi:hypothetical protein